METIYDLIHTLSVKITTSGIFLLLGGLGVFLLGIGIFRSKRVFRNQELEDKLCTLFFEQHLFLFLHKEELFEYEKVKELLFFGKNKFFDQPISHINKEKYLALGENDLNYVRGLVAPH